MAAVRAPGAGRDGVLGAEGWSGAPAPLKLLPLIQRGPAPDTRVRPLNRLRRALRPHQRDDPPTEDPASGVLPAAAARPSVPTAAAAAVEHAAAAVEHAVPTDGPDRPLTIPVQRITAPPKAYPGPQLAVHLLGPLYVAIDDLAVEEWPSARCRSLFGYLLTHRDPWPAREVLMEVFWPGSSPEAARNSLNVAIHGLRRTLRTITDLPIIVHAGGS